MLKFSLLFSLLLPGLSSAQSLTETTILTKTRLKETNLYQKGVCALGDQKIPCMKKVKLSAGLPEGTDVSVVYEKILSTGAVKYILDGDVLDKQSFPFIGGVKVMGFPLTPVEPATEIIQPTDEEIESLEGQDLYLNMVSIETGDIVAKKYPGKLSDESLRIPFVFRWDKHNPSGTWARYVYDQLDVLPTKLAEVNNIKDIEEFCPNYNKREFDLNARKIFWIGLLNEIAYRESLFLPMVQNDEGQYTTKNTGIISRGLMQMSYDSLRSETYRENGCLVQSAGDVHEPIKNLSCGLAIFSRFVGRDKCISCSRKGQAKGPSVYWSTLRSPYQIQCKDSKKCGEKGLTLGKKAGIIKSLANRIPFCFPEGFVAPDAQAPVKEKPKGFLDKVTDFLF